MTLNEIFSTDFFHNKIGFEKEISDEINIPFRFVYNGKRRLLKFFIRVDGSYFELFLHNKKLYKSLVNSFYELFGDGYYDGE